MPFTVKLPGEPVRLKEGAGMLIRCPQCSYIYDSTINENNVKKENTKCPRCGKIYVNNIGCENCKGCSLWKICKKD